MITKSRYSSRAGSSAHIVDLIAGSIRLSKNLRRTDLSRAMTLVRSPRVQTSSIALSSRVLIGSCHHPGLQLHSRKALPARSPTVTAVCTTLQCTVYSTTRGSSARPRPLRVCQPAIHLLLTRFTICTSYYCCLTSPILGQAGLCTEIQLVFEDLP